jgi:hypothetical protein
VQPRLNERVIKHRVLFAAGHEGEASQIGEDSPRAILSVEPKPGALFGELVCSLIATNGCQALTPFFPVVPVAPIAERAEPTFSYGTG